LKHSLYFIVSSDFLRNKPLSQVVKEAVAGGVDMIQLREKCLPARRVYELAVELKEALKCSPSRLLINDRVDIALAVGADGVHLSQNGLPVETVRRMVGHGMLIGVSTHSLEEAMQAEDEGADYVLYSPIFPTTCKPGAVPKGVKSLEEIFREVNIPVIPLGGINKNTLPEITRCGVTNAAVMSALLTAEDPKQAAAELKAILTGEDTKRA
jgi:thiamine-phosphate pyrophosphorylase